MESVIVSANVVVPLMILMLIGFAVRRSGLISENVLIKTNRLNYYIAVPALCIKKLYESEPMHMVIFKFIKLFVEKLKLDKYYTIEG